MSVSGIGTAIFGFFSGLITGWIILRRSRRPIQFDVPAIAWFEMPVPIWKQDWTQAVFVLIHALSILMIATLFLLDRDVPTDVLGSSRVTGTALWVVWMIAGSVLSFSIIYPYVGRMPMFAFSNAFARGQFVGEWDCFSYFRADPSTRIIYLYAALSPEIVRVAWQPTTDTLFNDVLDVLKTVLPDKPPSENPPWYRRRIVFIGTLLLVLLPFLIASMIIYHSAVPWGWLYYATTVPIIMVLGTVIIKNFEVD